MPKATDKTRPLTIYPPAEVSEKIEQLAKADGRSMSGLVLRWVEDRPEMQEATNGSR